MGSTDGTAQRKITAATCDEAVDALTLIAALLTNPSTDDARASATPTPQTAAVNTFPSTPPRAEEAPRASAPVPPKARNPEVTKQERARDPEVTKQDRAREARAPAAPNSPGKEAPPPPAKAPRETPTDEEEPSEVQAVRVPRHYVRRGEVVLSSLLASGITPAVRVGAGLEGALGWAAGTLDLVLLLGLRIALPYTVHSDEGSARFGWMSAVAGGCVGARARFALTGAGCLTGELGMIDARGQNTDAPAHARPLWAALGPALRLSYAPRRMLLLAATMSTLFSTARDRFLVADRELHRVPLLTFRCELGVGVRFE